MPVFDGHAQNEALPHDQGAVAERAAANACELTPAQGSIVDNASVFRARPYALSQAGGAYDGDIYMREDDLTAAMANCYIARKTVHDTPAGEELRFEYDYMPEPTLRFGDPDYVGWGSLRMFLGAISPFPVFGLKKRLEYEELLAQAYYADLTVNEQALNAACKYKAKKYCVGVDMNVISVLGYDNHNDPEYYTQGIFAGEYTELFGAFLRVPHNFASLSAWGEAYAHSDPGASETWCDIVEGQDATHYWAVYEEIELAYDNTSSASRLKELTLEQWLAFLIPFPREWA